MDTSMVPVAAKEVIKSSSEKILELVHKNNIIVVSGGFDKVEEVLSAMDVSHKLIEPHQVKYEHLNPSQILLVNCPGRIIDGRKDYKITNFVSSGGWLVTSDWALDTISELFPRTIKYNGKATPDDVVSVDPVISPLTNKMASCDFWLEGGSHPIEIIDESTVTTIVKSDEMNRKYNSPHICVGFQYGNGKVFHMVSHFILQRSKSMEQSVRDNVNIIQLLVNILAQKGARNK